MRVAWSDDALEDVSRLRLFLEPRSPFAARHATEALAKAALSLESDAERGRPVRRLPGFRDLFVPFGGSAYALRYHLDRDDIVIVRIWHGREKRTRRRG
jgi:plasmid stabilization system protein ParE